MISTLSALLLFASTPPVIQMPAPANRIEQVALTPEQAIFGAGQRPGGLSGSFLVPIVRGEQFRSKLFLGTRPDYRDPANLAIVFSGAALKALRAEVGPRPVDALVGRRLLVTGTARKVPIVLASAPGRVLFYQTHIEVTKPTHFKVLVN